MPRSRYIVRTHTHEKIKKDTRSFLFRVNFTGNSGKLSRDSGFQCAASSLFLYMEVVEPSQGAAWMVESESPWSGFGRLCPPTALPDLLVLSLGEGFPPHTPVAQ